MSLFLFTNELSMFFSLCIIEVQFILFFIVNVTQPIYEFCFLKRVGVVVLPLPLALAPPLILVIHHIFIFKIKENSNAYSVKTSFFFQTRDKFERTQYICKYTSMLHCNNIWLLDLSSTSVLQKIILVFIQLTIIPHVAFSWIRSFNLIFYLLISK